MLISVIKRPPVCIMRFMEDLTIETAVAAREEAETVLNAAHSEGEIIVDFSNVEHADASGVSAVISAMISSRVKGIRVMLYQPPKHIQQILEAMEVDGFFPLITSQEDLMSRLVE